MKLAQELAFFQKSRDRWIQEGRLSQWVVIRGEEVLGFFDSFHDAFAAGTEHFGAETDFLVKQIKQDEVVHTFQRVFPAAVG